MTHNGCVHPGSAASAMTIGAAGRDDRTHVRNEAKHGAERGPEQRIRHADDEEPHADGDRRTIAFTRACINSCRLTRSPASSKRPRRHRQVAVTDQPDQSAAQILSLEQHEDQQDDHEPRRRKRSCHGPEPRGKTPQARHLFGLHDDRRRRRPFRPVNLDRLPPGSLRASSVLSRPTLP